jgi:hypothetical protein
MLVSRHDEYGIKRGNATFQNFDLERADLPCSLDWTGWTAGLGSGRQSGHPKLRYF